ncbi:hypothetical protein TELCIR_03466 [Teladorsagia circumcincta]|uniref:Uncharacterized protein n=1 Tax=Teladorsagia circumcincta TaxID=45464 RepID=A0A2G9UWJ7_TELCI|nr:hypothetical protein TELCIR_03466 [Teladorsagia circumcincta]
MTSGQHYIRVEGGTPHLVIESGQACVEVRTNHGLPQIPGLLPPFVTPVDKFANLGPLEEPAEPSFPRPDEVAAVELGLNNTRCVTCMNDTAQWSSTKLPTHIVPTFPAQPHTATATFATFPTLVSLVTDQSSSFGIFPGITSTHQSEPPTVVPTVQLLSSTITVPSITEIPTSETSTVGQIITTLPSADTTILTSTSDQFVIGQFNGLSSQGSQVAATSPSPSSAPAVVTILTTPSPPIAITTRHEGLPAASPTPQPSSTISNGETEEFPTPVTLSSTTGGGGGSWENVETLFPTPPSSLPERKPSILVLRMKVPSDIDLNAFDFTSNLTSALNDVVRESVRRVRRTKRSSPESLQNNIVKVRVIQMLNSKTLSENVITL